MIICLLCATVVAESGLISSDQNEWNTALCETLSDASNGLGQYKALILNGWYSVIVIILCLSNYDWNYPLRTTHFWSIDTISRIELINLVNDLDLDHCASRAVFPSIWNQMYSFTDGVSFNDFVRVEWLYWYRQSCELGWTWKVVVLISHISGHIFYCFYLFINGFPPLHMTQNHKYPI